MTDEAGTLRPDASLADAASILDRGLVAIIADGASSTA